MKAVIYLRVSTKDQNPKLQMNECMTFAKNKGYDIVAVFEENLSAFKKDIVRPDYEEVKEMARKGEVKAVIVWALDRWVRSRETLIQDVVILRNYGCKLHSVKEAWLEAINIDGPLGNTIQDFLLGLIGSLSEMESQRKSERVKLAFESHEGKNWGRPSLPEKTRLEVIKLWKEGKSMREISKSIKYWDKNRNEKLIGLATVHKIITEEKGKKQSFEGTSEFEQLPNAIKDLDSQILNQLKGGIKKNGP